MIPLFVERFMEAKPQIRADFANGHPETYQDIVKTVVNILHDENDLYPIDPRRITCIDHGEYQGTLLFVIAAEGYQPDHYWYTTVYYGSCSGCDTLQGIHNYDSDPPNDSQLDQYMKLALHIVQKLKPMT